MPKTKLINKHIQEQQRKSDLVSESIFENIPMGVFRISGDPSGEFLVANSEFLRIFRLDSFDALLGIKMRDLFLSRDEWEDFYIELHAKKQVSGLEVQLNEISGSSYWASINARLIEEEDSETDRCIDGTLVCGRTVLDKHAANSRR